MGVEPGALTAPARAAYEDFFPYYAEFSALSELRKKPGFGATVRSGIGGHALLYLNGVRLEAEQNYPVLRLCAPDEPPSRHGVGISVNSHYRNANWVAVEGRDFLWRGALEKGEALTREAYARTQDLAKARGWFDAVEFHTELFRDRPAGMSARDYKYEISVATDYAAQFGRDGLSIRIPLDARRMGAMIACLNALNAPYRGGGRIYKWRLFTDNCVHVAYNAFAAAGICAPWPTGRFAAGAAFNFPAPKNALVDLIHASNDLPLGDAQYLYEDKAARAGLCAYGALPTAPGALLAQRAAIGANEVYDVRRLRLIFYDNIVLSSYRRDLKTILREPRYFDLEANFADFAARYMAARACPRGRALRGARAEFQERYDTHLADAAGRLDAYRAKLAGPA